MTITAGTQLGRYEIRSKIGAGGMGEVYLARDTSELERTVALKFLPAELASDQKRMQRFIQEAKTVSALNHPNILTIYEFGQADSVRFISMEYVDGVTLREEMRGRLLKLHDVLDIAIQIAAALNAAHEAGVVHRDIKPENIMVRRDHIVKVLDFGLAKLTMKDAAESVSVDSEAGTKVLIHTEPGMVMGTVSYMSPEQSQGSQAVDQRTDIWSLGVVLYEMVAGRVPFEGKDIHRQIIAIQESDPLPLSKFAEGVPERLEEIVLKALAKDVDERYQTAKDLLIDLRNLKRKLDIDAEIERTIAPELRGASSTPSVVSDAQPTLMQTATVTPAQPTSSAEYIVQGVRKHKAAFTALLLILLLAVGGLSVWYFSHHSANAKQIESIAVLPFVNESGNADLEYLSDGMTESLIGSLSQIPNLNVKARSSVFRYKGKDASAQTVGKELNVQAILNGRVVQRGNDLTLYVELVDTTTENVLWKADYNRSMANLVSLQGEIARDVSNKLRARLSGADEQRVAKTYTTDPEAYQLYLKGRYYWNKRTPTDIRKSVEYFQQAIDKDPTFALAYAGLAEAYILIANYSNESPHETYPKATAAAMKALEIDETLAEAHAALASVKLEYDWNFADAEREFKRAIELNPNYPTAHQWYAEYLLEMGRNEEAITEIKRAQELDPLSLIINTVAGNIYAESRQYDRGIEQLRKTIEMDQNFPVAHRFLAEAYVEKGMFEEAITEGEKAAVLDGATPEQTAPYAASLREAYKHSGANGFWRKQIEFYELARSLHPDNLPSLGRAASFYAQIGEKEKAMALLEKAYEQRDASVTKLKSPIYDPIRSDPRFQDLVQRVGLPQ